MEPSIEIAMTTTCRKCGLNIDEEKFVAAQDSVWHCRCFTCVVCSQELTCTYYEQDGQPYCTRDFFTKFGSLCDSCDACITGPMMCAGDRRYHPECFVCEQCQQPIIEGDSFALLDRRHLFCDTCFKEKGPSSKTRIITTVQLPTTNLDLLHISSKPIRKKKKKNRHFLQKVFRKGNSGSTSSSGDGGGAAPPGVQEGDRIIEVNGIQVTDHSSDEVWELIKEQAGSSQGITLTIERRYRPVINPKIELPKSPAGGTDVAPEKSSSRGPGFRPRSSSSRLANHLRNRSTLQRKHSDPVCRHHEISLPSPLADAVDPQSLLYGSMPSASTMALASITSPECSSDASCGAVRKCQSVTSTKLELTGTSSLPTGGTMKLSVTEDESKPPRLTERMRRCPSVQSSASCEDDDDDDDDDEDRPLESEHFRQPRSQQASAQQVTKIFKKLERSRTSTLPLRGHELHKTMNVAYSALCRRETLTGINMSSRSVFRTKDLEIGEVLGQGFFGRAVKVTNKANGQVMVMKELVNSTAEARHNFLQEVQMMKALDHVNVMPLLGIMYRGRNLCIITEFIGGGTLSERIMDKTKSLPDMLKVKFACDIASGMAYLHANKIIHRDLTSNNCMIRTNESVVVGDFGLAKVLARNNPDQLKVVGSAYWMAPEMMLGKRYDCRADIFSYGIITCELIGRISADPDEMPRTKDYGLDEAEFSKQFLGEFSPQVFQVPLHACKLNPDDRPSFQTIEAFLMAVITALDNGVVLGQPLSAFIKFYEISKAHK